MRQNLPVNNTETLLPEGEFIYSRTDLNSHIVEANEAFAKISGFEREEMLGQPHNMVRHPDMPKEAFADLWADLKAGRPWRGLVKNRRNDGGYYWVVANASPVREEGRAIGYQSIRTCPSREEVAAADAIYKRIREGDRSLKIEHGRVIKKYSRFVNMLSSLEFQISAMAGLMIVLASFVLADNVLNFSVPIPVVTTVACLSGLLGLVLLLVVAPVTQRSLRAVADHMEYVLTSGDLTRRFSLERRDVIGVISRGFDTLTSSLQATMQCIDDATQRVEKASQEVAASVHQVKASATVQSEATRSASAAVEEVMVAIAEVATHTTLTREASIRSGEAARHGANQSNQVSTIVEQLAQTVQTSAKQIEELGERSNEISHVTNIIKEIAEQTNLLALNAAIEAARAGEAGRGFAVVADEVRKLAERTGKATQEISVMTASIIEQTGSAVTGMRTGGDQVKSSVAMVSQAKDTLDSINNEMKKTIDMVSEITHATIEQQNAMTDLSGGINRVSEMTEQNLHSANHTELLAHGLNNSVERMAKAVAQYTIY